ncbi:RNA polymerase subunit sigma-70 [Bacillus sp. FJAT-27225]|uniref:sigma-70 family RNA polymerase sigma factor n=1 Tax=Bacillus sp. FJAT-27225 TaxID=1743144 RepID=UPI00080C2ADC|nr:sigma-70 family RNA polymerase sigma factor [Bacillus sp. FJAT-27225]OCA83038.1 RNA polymerase subunit sigma-70 [Bacillus sp. FJAT-27225]
MDGIEQTAKKAIKGDDDAFLHLMNVYKLDLYKTALAFLRNDEEALEAVQEVTFRAYKGIRKLRDATYVKTWLIRIMINYCNDVLRKKKRFVLDEEFILAQGKAENKESLELWDAMQSLDPRSQEILALKYFQDLKIKEIAAALNYPEGTIKTWLNKALKSLKGKLEDKGGRYHA